MAGLPLRQWFARAGAVLGRALLRWSERVDRRTEAEELVELRARFPGAPEAWLQAVAERIHALGAIGIDMPLNTVSPPPVTLLRPPRRVDAADAQTPRKDEAIATPMPRKARAEGSRWLAPAKQAVARPAEFVATDPERAEIAAQPAAPARKPLLRPILFRAPARTKPTAPAPSSQPPKRAARPVMFLMPAEASRAEPPALPAAPPRPRREMRFTDISASEEQQASEPWLPNEAGARDHAEPAWAVASKPALRVAEFTAPNRSLQVPAAAEADAGQGDRQRPSPPDHTSAAPPGWPALPEQHLRPSDSAQVVRMIESRTRLERLKREQTERLWNG